MNAVLTPTQPIQRGKPFIAEGRNYTLYDIERTPKGWHVWVSVDGRRERWKWKKFLAKVAGTASYAGEFSSVEDDFAPLLGLLPADERARVVQRMRDLMELHTGDPFGTFDDPRPWYEIREEYDPRKVPNLVDRIATKTKELKARGETGVGQSTLYDEYAKLFRPGGEGIVGLIRAKYRKRLSPILDLPDDVKVIAKRVAVELAATSGSVSIRNQTADTVAELAAAGYTDIPHAKMRDLIDVVSVGLNLRRPGKARQSLAVRPGSHPHRSTQARYPGHVVQLDTTPLNMFVRSDNGRVRMSVDVLTAIDVFSRMVMAVRVVEAPHTAIDVNLLLHDMLGAEFFRATWKTGSDHVWLGLPREIHIPDDGTLQFGMKIKSVVMDLGSQYNNTTTLAVLARHGIRVFFTPPRKGTAKGIVESFQRAFSKLTEGLPGDKGRSPEHRGPNPKNRVLPTLDRVEGLLWEFISDVYNHHHHRRLRDPEARKQTISPMDMFAQHILMHGIVHVPLRPNFRLAFLKATDVSLGDEGIWVDGVRFDSDLPEFDELRRRRDNAPKLHVRYDPRDLTRIWVWHATRRIWLLTRDYDTLMTYRKVNEMTRRWLVRDNDVPSLAHTQTENNAALGRVRRRFRTNVDNDHKQLMAQVAADNRASRRAAPVRPAQPSTAALPDAHAAVFVDVSPDPEAPIVTAEPVYMPRKVRR